MGTSKSYSAPTGGLWTQAKTTASKFGGQAGTDFQREYPGDVAAAYLGAIGGVAAAVARAAAAHRAAFGLASFASAASRSGLAQALENRELDALRNQPVPEVLAALVDQLAGDGALLEEAAARDALAEVLGEVFGDAETFQELDALFGEIDAARLRNLLQRFFARYVYLRLLQELLASIERGARTIEQAERARRALKEFIEAEVTITFVDTNPLEIDWASDKGQAIVANWIREAYEGLK